MLNMSCSVGNDYCIAHANALCRTEPWNTFQKVNEIDVGTWRSELPSSSILWKILLPASWIWTSSRATVVCPKVLWWSILLQPNDSLLFRVAAPGHGQPPPGYNWLPNAGHSKPPSKVMFVMLRKSTHERPNLPRCKWQHVYKSIFSGSGYHWYYQLSPPMSRFSMNSRLQPAFLRYNLTLLLVTSSLKGDSSGGSVVAISFGSPWLSQGYG